MYGQGGGMELRSGGRKGSQGNTCAEIGQTVYRPRRTPVLQTLTL